MILSVQRNSQSWVDLPWKKFQRHLLGLQVRVFRAKQEGNYKKMSSLQKLLINSKAARYIAIQEATKQSTTGPTLTPNEKFALEKSIYRRLKNNQFCSLIKTTDQMTLYEAKTWQILIFFTTHTTSREQLLLNESEMVPVKIKQILLNSLEAESYSSVLTLNFEDVKPIRQLSSFLTEVHFPKKIKVALYQLFEQDSHQSSLKAYMISQLLTYIVSSELKLRHIIIKSKNKLFVLFKREEKGEQLLPGLKHCFHKNGIHVKPMKASLQPLTDGFQYANWYFSYSPIGDLVCQQTKISQTKFSQSVKSILRTSNLGPKSKVQQISKKLSLWSDYNHQCKPIKKNVAFALKKQAWKRFKTQSQDEKSLKLLMEKTFPKYKSGLHSPKKLVYRRNLSK
jgi:hypothetical protein